MESFPWVKCVGAAQTSAGKPTFERSCAETIAGDKLPAYIGDAVELDSLSDLKLNAIIQRPYNEKFDSFDGLFSVSEHEDLLEYWLQDYDPHVQSFIKTKISDVQTKSSIEGSKIGCMAYRNDMAANEHPAPLIIRPLNHLVTTAFNRDLALDRLNIHASPTAHMLWEHCLHEICEPTQGFNFPCPSQLFIEFGIITSDYYVPITEKNTTTSVYAKRNNTSETNKLKTCGIESGPKWNDVIKKTDQKDIVKLDVSAGIISGLKREFPMPDWNDKEDQISVEMISYGLQMLHFNTALLGTCKVPYTKDEMLSQLRGKKGAGGLDHSNLYFISIQECSEYVGKYSATTGWHGTAIMRLQMIADKFR